MTTMPRPLVTARHRNADQSTMYVLIEVEFRLGDDERALQELGYAIEDVRQQIQQAQGKR